MVQPLWKTVWQFLKKVKHRITIWFSNSTPIYSKELEIETDKYSEIETQINTHGSIIHISQKMETTQVSINRWTDKQNVAYIDTGIVFSHKNKWSSDTCYKVDEPWKHYAKWNKPDPKGETLHDSTCMKSLQQANL